MSAEPEVLVSMDVWTYLRDIICDAVACPDGGCGSCPLGDDADKQAFIEWRMRKLDQ